MTSTVLARKWRPRNFSELVGQEHVVRALSNALEQKRLHHAYLLTGTRGVGKTTLARIMAKALNCATGITPTPCGQCAACKEIDASRFIDLIELDAASHTQVDHMRELLENAQYLPTAARFKVYIIDEVHMLSKSAFNAMLKTLEEPPEHVKFILATTEPQKIPVTVLSRCLQFNLKQIPPLLIREQMQSVLAQEQIVAEAPALQLISRAAQGSMRDALSLLDQAIAHGAGSVSEADVRAMLGAIDQTYLFAILQAVAAGDGPLLIDHADRMQCRSLSFDVALQDLGALLHRIALAQSVPAAIAADEPERETIFELATAIAREDVQLLYQIALQGRDDLVLAPDEYAGFTMTLLRMLAFMPAVEDQALQRLAAPTTAVRTTAARPASAPLSPAPSFRRSSEWNADTPPLAAPSPAPAAFAPKAMDETTAGRDSVVPSPGEGGQRENLQPGEWAPTIAKMKLNGMAKILAQNCELVSHDGARMEFRVAQVNRSYIEKPYRDKLKAALERHFGKTLWLNFALGDLDQGTPLTIEKQERDADQAKAEAAIEDDPFVRELVQNLGGHVVKGSIQSLKKSGENE
ncbi:MAG: DNA polymerase III subunit gamma/tau [Burkholderiales bacterium]|nr:DNA polymerase III subunit gamma/tau [Burkholderiales bacterium]